MDNGRTTLCVVGTERSTQNRGNKQAESGPEIARVAKTRFSNELRNADFKPGFIFTGRELGITCRCRGAQVDRSIMVRVGVVSLGSRSVSAANSPLSLPLLHMCSSKHVLTH